MSQPLWETRNFLQADDSFNSTLDKLGIIDKKRAKEHPQG